MPSLLRNKMRLFIILFVLIFALDVSAASLQTKAEYAYMIDYETGQVLFEKNSTQEMGPSSMTKMMTAYMIFDGLKNGGLSLETKFPVSVKAWKKGGSKMYVKEGDDVLLGDLLQGIVVASGNDACIVVAEGMAGSEELFAQDMTAMGKQIGLTNSHFKNSTGWPDKNHIMTAKDLVTLATRLIKDFPEYYHYFSQEYFTYSKIKQRNRNKLLYRNIGVDGLKTGFTNDNGYGIVVSAEQDGRRVILAVNGLTSSKQRMAEAERLVRHGFRDFQNVALYSAGDKVEEAKIWMGQEGSIDLLIEEDLNILSPKRASQRQNYELSVSYDSPIVAPVGKGQKIANLTLTRDDIIVKEIPLVAAQSVEKLNLLGRMQFIIMDKLFGSDE